jgi:hypothetical protein
LAQLGFYFMTISAQVQIGSQWAKLNFIAGI